MYLEDRVGALEAENKDIRARLERLERAGSTRYVTARELAELMGCSVQNIHRKIKTGELRATHLLGDARIPMVQFWEDANRPVERPAKREPTIKERVFG